MPFNNHTFLFSSLDSKQPSTARKVHIRCLYDILQLSIQRHQFQRAKRVWAILVHCKEIDWKGLWNVGLHILSEDTTSDGGEHVAVEYLRSMMLQCPDNVSIFIFLIFSINEPEDSVKPSSRNWYSGFFSKENAETHWMSWNCDSSASLLAHRIHY